MTTVALSAMHWPVTTLGPGRRVGIWFQGCGIGCAGCLARDTWSPDGGTDLPVAQVVERAVSVGAGDGAGVTISGGEPFGQPEALGALIRQLRDRGLGSILVYSGFTPAQLGADHGDLLAHCDGVVAGPYQAWRAGSDHWRGSTNQELLVPTELGRRVLQPWAEEEGQPRIEVAVAGEKVTMVGIPAAGALTRFDHRVADAGLETTRREWRPSR